MEVQVGYKNKNLETIEYDILDFDIYLCKLAQDAISALSDIEKCLSLRDIDYNTDENFRFVRHKLLNLAGALRRLPSNIIKDNDCAKTTKKGLLSAIQR